MVPALPEYSLEDATMGIPTDLKIDSARESTNKAISKVESSIEDAVSRGQTPKATHLAKLDDLVLRRAAIEDMASTSAQRESYAGSNPDRTAWHQEFIRMRDVYLLKRLEELRPGCAKLPLSDETQEALARFFADPSASLPPSAWTSSVGPLRSQLWRALPHSRFKTFQEAFCAPLNFAVPLERLDYKQLNRLSLSACLVSPDYVPNKLLSNLGLVSWPDETPERLAALAAKSSPAIINGLKGIFESLQPIAERNSRIKEVRNYTPEVLGSYPVLAAIDPTVFGSLICTRERVSGSTSKASKDASKKIFSPRGVTVSVYASAYSMLRKTVREELSFDHEQQELSDIVSSWVSLRDQLDKDWGAAAQPYREDLKRRVLELCDRSTELFEKSENLQKKGSLALIAKVRAKAEEAPSRPELVMTGITPMLTQITVAIENLRLREAELSAKGKFNEQDQRDVKRIIDGCEEQLRSLRSNLLRVDHRSQSFVEAQLSALEGKLAQPGLTDAKRNQLVLDFFGVCRLRDLLTISRFSVRPFRAFGETLNALGHELRTAILSNNPAASRDALVKMAAVCKIVAANELREKLSTELASSSNTEPSPEAARANFQDMLQRVNRLLVSLNTQEILPGHVVASYQAPYDEVVSFFRKLRKGLSHYASEDVCNDPGPEGLAEKLRAGLLEKMEEFLDLSDLEGVVRHLSAAPSSATH